ncbi:MAG TPA: hypothetical protein PL196_00050 [Burkholderiaceae bacterium]|nr:hypothetical protein [Burkholderiaceae bacterium]
MDCLNPSTASGGFTLFLGLVALAGGFYLRGLWIRKSPESLQRFIEAAKKLKD